ncbi:MAG: nucleotide exchange factor GrpE [Chloroflexi bacterium]|nr:nucleotide exchange factor GrpE [Chloroflexota bacterium]
MARKEASETKKKAAREAAGTSAAHDEEPSGVTQTGAADAAEDAPDPAVSAERQLKDLETAVAAANEALAAKEEELQQVRESLARARADFANFRRRTQQEQEEQAKFGTALLVAEFLPILDNFERALDTIPRELRFFSWLQGVDLVHQMARNVLEKRGLQPIDTQDKPFDPNYHEVVLREGEDDDGEVVVLEELQKGYVMYDRVLRPSLVKVGPPPSADDAAEQEDEDGDVAEAGSASDAQSAAETDQT